jgi:2-C-methyl-D-erythritol 4-phosphate cytidylyltransferase
LALALIVAAGRGERLGSDGPKALVELRGRPLYQWSLAALCRVEAVDKIVLAMPSDYADYGDGKLELGVTVSSASGSPPEVVAVAGGATRSESVRRALAAAGGTDAAAAGAEQGKPGKEPREVVIVHDAARPLLTPELVERAIATLMGDASLAAAIAAAPVADTVKRAATAVAQGAPALVEETLDRSGLWAVQTPQAFRRAALEQALDVPDEILAQATDDAWLIERAGGRVAIVPTDAENLKVTTPLDLALAELLLARRHAGVDSNPA